MTMQGNDRQPSPNRIYRDPANGVVMGVCAGLADYFGLSVTTIRVIAVFGLVFGFFLPVAVTYFAAAFVLQVKPTDLYASGEEEVFWRKTRLDPSRSASDLSHKFRDLERRLRESEAYVTSSEFKLKRDFRNL